MDGLGSPSYKGPLIPRHRSVHELAPGVDAAAHILDVFEPLVPQPLGNSGASPAMMAMHHNPLAAVRLQVPQPRGDGPHGDLHRPFDRRGGEFVRLADIEQHEPFPVRLHLLNGEDIDIRRQRLAIHGKPAPRACRINSRQPIRRLRIRPHPLLSRLLTMLDPALSRQFAVDVVEQLRAAGHQALWAGGCVRDQLLGKTPKDYDVATDAEPERIRDVFGRKRTLAIGAAFGVITVLGPKDAGQIEVATFRRDIGYSDGRRPDAVAFTSAEEDAKRRDFTINGIFYDPVAHQYLDYVGGQEDLQNHVLRAIGNPHDRFAEDKLRMLRAVRFAATLEFTLEHATYEAIKAHASQITIVSGERIAAEMRRILVHPNRVAAVEMLRDSRLLEFILPESRVLDDQRDYEGTWEGTTSLLGLLQSPGFPLALAALLFHMRSEADLLHEEAVRRKEEESEVSLDPKALIAAVTGRWKLSNEEREDLTVFLTQSHLIRWAGVLRGPRWGSVQQLLIARTGRELLDFTEAVETIRGNPVDYIPWYREKLKLPREQLDPPPLITGDDLKAAGEIPGRLFASALSLVRQEQLDGILQTKDQGLQRALEWMKLVRADADAKNV